MFPIVLWILTTNGRALVDPLTGSHFELDFNTCVASLALDLKHRLDQPRGRRSLTVTKRLFQYSHQRGRRTEILFDCRLEIKGGDCSRSTSSAVHSIQYNNTLHSPRRARTAASSNIPMFPIVLWILDSQWESAGRSTHWFTLET